MVLPKGSVAGSRGRLCRNVIMELHQLYLRRGETCIRTSWDVYRQLRCFYSAVILLYIGSEQVFKGVLLKNDYSNEQLQKDYGHDLELLYNECCLLHEELYDKQLLQYIHKLIYSQHPDDSGINFGNFVEIRYKEGALVKSLDPDIFNLLILMIEKIHKKYEY